MVLLSERGDSSAEPAPARLRAASRPILTSARIADPRAYLWTAAGLEQLATGLGLSSRSVVIDAGCGWGGLGASLALHVPGLRVVGVDLERELIALGQRVVESAGLQRRVRLVEGDLDDLEPGRHRGATAVVCQAVLCHLPRAGEWVAALAARCPPGTVVGFVERDAVGAARSIRDTVTDGDDGYALGRDEVVRAVVRGARETLGVERRAGAALAGWLEGAGLVGVAAVPLAADTWLRAPFDPRGPRAVWFRERLGSRLGGVDPVERGLAVAGGLADELFRDWGDRREEADRRRLAALDQGRWGRDERGGWSMAWGRVPPMR